MICALCGTDCKLFRQIFANGTVHVVERCPICGANPDKHRPFLLNETVENVNALPVWGISTVQVTANQPELPKTKPQPIYYHLGGR